MNKELMEALNRELAAAFGSGDANQIYRALINSQKAVISCLAKTAPTSFVAGNLAAFGSDGNLVDTGYHIEDTGGAPTLVKTI